jgi:hypothetical protein
VKTLNFQDALLTLEFKTFEFFTLQYIKFQSKICKMLLPLVISIWEKYLFKGLKVLTTLTISCNFRETLKNPNKMDMYVLFLAPVHRETELSHDFLFHFSLRPFSFFIKFKRGEIKK